MKNWPEILYPAQKNIYDKKNNHLVTSVIKKLDRLHSESFFIKYTNLSLNILCLIHPLVITV